MVPVTVKTDNKEIEIGVAGHMTFSTRTNDTNLEHMYTVLELSLTHSHLPTTLSLTG